MDKGSLPPGVPTAVPTIDSLDNRPNYLLGIIGGVIAMLVGAIIWGLISYFTEYQIGWMSIGVGALVGFTIQKLSKGNSITFGIIAGLLSLVGCLLGNLFFYCGAIAREYGVDFFEVLFTFLGDPETLFELFKTAFSYMDLLFYVIAIYTGFRTAFKRPVSQTTPKTE